MVRQVQIPSLHLNMDFYRLDNQVLIFTFNCRIKPPATSQYESWQLCTLIRIFSEVYTVKFKQNAITIYTWKVTQMRELKAQPFMMLCKPTERLCGFSSETSAHGHHFNKTRNFEGLDGNASLYRTIMCCRNENVKENTSTIWNCTIKIY